MAATQITHSWRAVTRTALAIAIAVITVIPTFLSQFHVPIAGVAAIIVAVGAVITKVLANPLLEAFLQQTRWLSWLAAAPVEAAQIAADVAPAVTPISNVYNTVATPIVKDIETKTVPSLAQVVDAVQAIPAVATTTEAAVSAVAADVKADVAQ